MRSWFNGREHIAVRAIEQLLSTLNADPRDSLVFHDNPQREGLFDTPVRFAEAWGEWVSGYGFEPADVLKTFEDGSSQYDEMVFVGATPFYSLCEHHLAPFFGVAHVGYVPGGKIVGLSKISRLLDVFARRLQVQERLTVQIADALSTGLRAQGVGVVLRARHMCMESRGIKKSGSLTITSALRGCLKKEPDARAEFFKLVDMADRNAQHL